MDKRVILESHIEETIVHRAKKAGWFVRKLQWIGVTGAPDRIFVRGGRVVFIEFKRPGGVQSGRQKREHRAMREVGAEVHLIDNVDEATEVLGI